MGLTDLVEEYLLVRTPLSVGIGITILRAAAIASASTALLAVMTGSISLTLSVEQFRQSDHRMLASVLPGHVAVPILAFGLHARSGCRRR